LNNLETAYNENTSSVFVVGYINIATDKREKYTAPYRFTAIQVKKNNNCKFRQFDGSNPGGKYLLNYYNSIHLLKAVWLMLANRKAQVLRS
jgi:hypothetical protein